MGALIHLATPVAAGDDAARVYYAVGRSLTAADFAQQGRYIDARLLGLAPADTGAITGLGISPSRYDSPDGTTGLATLTIGIGTAIGSDGRLVRLTTPISLNWQALLRAVNPSAGTIADGIYLLILRTAQFDGVEGPPPDPCTRGSTDPLLDIRQDSFVEPFLSASLGPLPASRSTAGMALAINTLVGSLTQTSLAGAVGNGVPVALLLCQNNQLILLSQAAGRVAADPNGVGGLLLAQMREALAMALQEPAANPTSAAWQTAISARFRFLPAAGELPLGMLLMPGAITASCPFFPPGIAVFLQIIRASQATHLLQKALGRPQIDLASNTGEAVTLSLAVPDLAWTPDLLSIPRGDPVLAADLHLSYAQARAAQVAMREDWVALYGGLTAIPTTYPQETAFLAGADAAAQNLGFLLSIGAIQIQDLLAAATTASTPATFMPLVTNWIAAVNAAASAAPAAASAGVAAAVSVAAAPSGSTPAALSGSLTTALSAWPAAAAAAAGAASAGGSAAAITLAAAVAAAAASLPAGSSASAIAAANAAGAAAANATTAALAAGISGLNVNNAALAAATPPASVPPLPPAAPNPANAPQLLANLGYQVIDLPEPLQADPSLPPYAPASSDGVLAPLEPFLPANSNFASWSSAILAAAAPPTPIIPIRFNPGIVAPAVPALLQPLVNAGILDAGADPGTWVSTITALLALPAVGTAANDDTQPGTLLQLAVLQLFYAILGRVTRAQEYLLDAHSRFLALQRQHLDMMSTYVSALAGGVPSDGSGLSFTRIIPFFSLGNAPASASASATQAAPAAPQLAIREARVVLPSQQAVAATVPAVTSTTMRANLAVTTSAATPVIRDLPISQPILASPTLSNIGSLFGNQTDVAKDVASQTAALTQAPPFSYAPVQFGLASHITSGSTLFQTAQSGLTGLRTLMGQRPIGLVPTTPTATTGADELTDYAGVVATTRNLLGDMAQVETNAIRIESGYMQLRDQVQTMQATVSQLTATLATARDTLRSAQLGAAQAAGDYAAAQKLVQEEIARVTAANLARTQAIGSATGLFMVRQLQTVITADTPASLVLAANTPADLAPGCLADHPGPPASLTPFLNLLLEVPLGNWGALQGGWTALPDNDGLQRLSALRGARPANWAPSADVGSGAAASDLATLATTTRAVFDPVLRANFAITDSLAASQLAAFQVFSPPDIFTLPVNTLRTSAALLRDRLEAATGCLFQTLIALPPSARFAWATMARAGTLPSLSFAQWPLPAGLGDSGTAVLRQLAALVSWMGAQLTNGASAAAQTALGNLVSAAVIAAAYGDPDEAVTGTVSSTGGVPQPGVPIRVVLNRPPPIGTMLNVFDAKQSLVATLRVQDHDSFGTTANIVTSFATTAPTTSWTVASPGGRSPWLAS